MLNLPQDPRTAAFKAVRARLRNDPVLQSVIRQWYDTHPERPTISELPYMVVGMKAGPIGIATPVAHNSVMVVGIDYVVNAAGSDAETAWEDITNLYGQIEKAINPFGEITWLSDAGAAFVRGTPTFLQQGFTTIPMDGVNAIGGSCTFSVTLRINTCRTQS
jgi:hypothetical protein